MCSILGFFNTSLSFQDIKNLNNKMAHRGPDNSTIKKYSIQNKTLFLAHNRLAIQDLDNKANQPMENDRFVIIFNGEIYNHFEIRKELKVNFKTHSDTETLLWSFTEWGVKKTINLLNGMFAIALFDKTENKIYLIRDRIGIKPLYYRFENGEFSFSSDTIAFPNKIREDESLVKFMVFGYIPNDKSYYKNIYKLKAGHILTFNIQHSTFNINKYWDLPNEKINVTFNEAVEEVEYLLKDSIKKRLLADVEVGSFLSGGVDSSLVSAIMAQINSKRIKTFTIGFKEKDYNESEYAKKIAKHIKSEHFEYYFSAKDVLNLIDKIDYYFDEPFGDPSALPTMLLSKITKQNVTVSLSGDGGDELFLGYDRYFFTQNYYNKLKKLPFRNLLGLVCKKIPNDKCNKMAYPIRYLSKENLYAILYSALKPWELERIFNKEFLRENYTLSKLLEYENKLDTIENFSRLDFYRYLPDDILVKVDRASMAYSLEARVPILDYRIVEFAYKLPQNIKLQNGAKSILKTILYKYVPKELIDRPKMGFGVPLKEWFRNELKGVLFDKINSLDENIFNKKEIRNLFKLHQRGYNYSYIFWNLIRVK